MLMNLKCIASVIIHNYCNVFKFENKIEKKIITSKATKQRIVTWSKGRTPMEERKNFPSVSNSRQQHFSKTKIMFT